MHHTVIFLSLAKLFSLKKWSMVSMIFFHDIILNQWSSTLEATGHPHIFFSLNSLIYKEIYIYYIFKLANEAILAWGCHGYQPLVLAGASQVCGTGEEQLQEHFWDHPPESTCFRSQPWTNCGESSSTEHWGKLLIYFCSTRQSLCWISESYTF